MRFTVLPDIDPAGIARAAGASSYARGLQYVRQDAVLQMRWDPDDLALHGEVRGRSEDSYETTAYFAAGAAGPLVFEQGQCSCPVGFNCKHVVALVVTAAASPRPRTALPGTAAGTAPAGTAPAAVATAGPPPRPAWEASLEAVLAPTRTGHPAAGTGATPLAVELTLDAGRQPSRRVPGVGAMARPRLLAQLVQPGRNGWIRGPLAWSRLGSLHYDGDYVPEHVALLQEIYALFRSRDTTRHGYYGYGDDRTIDLLSFESPRLWPLLDDAAALDLRLVHPKKNLGTVERHGSAELCLNVTTDEPSGSLAVTPVVRVVGADDPDDAVPVAFVGAVGHGVVHVSGDDARRAGQPGFPGPRLRLARLARPVPADLQRMVLGGQRLEVPDAERSRFRDRYCPRLRQVATVVSSDGSFTPPEIGGPTLVLRAAYGRDHDLDLGWEWLYTVGDTGFRSPLGSDPARDGYRDAGRERTVLEGLDLPVDGPAGALRTGPDRILAPTVGLDGIEAMRVATEVLPLLADRPDVVVEVTGDRPNYREVGDSLRIGVSTGEVPGQRDWFDLGVTISVEGRAVPFTDVFVALSSEQSHLLLPDGAYFSLDKPELRSLRTLITEARALQEKPGDPLRISRFQAGLWEELAALGVIDHQAREWRQQVEGLLSIGSVDPVDPPASLSARLRPYQVDGFRWLAFLWEHGFGGILADDMGLGKTLQALALMCHARQADPTLPPFLVVAPTSVVSNWAAEAARFAPGLTVATVTETERRRGTGLGEAVAGAHLVVTSYTLFRLEIDEYTAMPWAGLVLDEAQFVKNHQSKAHQCARRLVAPVKLAITGTPMENNLMELWSLLSVTAPGLFPNPTRFQEYYARPLERRGDPELLARLRRRIRPLVMRRTKEQVVADLPEKQEQTLEVELHPRHRRIYQTHLQRERAKVLGLVDDMNRNRFTILRSLTLLRRLSLHAEFVDGDHSSVPCAKVDALLEQLADVVDGGHRALVFSQFTGFLDIVRTRLSAAGLDFCYLDGATRNRARVIEGFKKGSAPVFLISLRAGGVGLNLTEADYCFLLDPWWNPATENQAVDRTHRIGQTRNVMVYRLVARDTIEEKVMALKARKAELFASVMDDGDMFGSALDADDVRALLA